MLLLVACSKPEPPTLKPKSVTVTSVSPAALGLEVTLDATNPNAIDIPARNVTAHVTIDSRIEVGVTTVDEKVTLPANQTTELKVAVSVPWTNVAPLVSLGLSDQRFYPYAVDGTLALGGDLIQVSVPFHLEGKVTRDQILHATLSSIPAIPGITAPPVGSANPRGPHPFH
jgi:LEA14-like dessication related protein